MRLLGGTAEQGIDKARGRSYDIPLMRWGGRLLTAGALAATLAACNSGTTNNSAAVTPTPRPGRMYNITETEYFGANTFEVYQNASGVGPHLNIGDKVVAACLIYDPNTTVTSTRGYWYRLQNPVASDGHTLYAPANTFANEVPGDPPARQNAYDPRLELCADSPSRDLPPAHHD